MVINHVIIQFNTAIIKCHETTTMWSLTHHVVDAGFALRCEDVHPRLQKPLGKGILQLYGE